MKAEIREDGSVHIIAENITEAFALKAISPITEKPCDKCGQVKLAVVIDGSILNR